MAGVFTTYLNGNTAIEHNALGEGMLVVQDDDV
jgi:hypothetical protein